MKQEKNNSGGRGGHAHRQGAGGPCGFSLKKTGQTNDGDRNSGESGAAGTVRGWRGGRQDRAGPGEKAGCPRGSRSPVGETVMRHFQFILFLKKKMCLILCWIFGTFLHLLRFLKNEGGVIKYQNVGLCHTFVPERLQGVRHSNSSDTGRGEAGRGSAKACVMQGVSPLPPIWRGGAAVTLEQRQEMVSHTAARRECISLKLGRARQDLPQERKPHPSPPPSCCFLPPAGPRDASLRKPRLPSTRPNFRPDRFQPAPACTRAAAP